MVSDYFLLSFTARVKLDAHARSQAHVRCTYYWTVSNRETFVLGSSGPGEQLIQTVNSKDEGSILPENRLLWPFQRNFIGRASTRRGKAHGVSSYRGHEWTVLLGKM